MISMIVRKLVLSVALLAMAGCGATRSSNEQPSAPAVRQVTQSAHCGLTGPGVAWVERAEQREALLDVGGQNMATDMVREVDLSREYVLFVTLGKKPTAGYGVGLDEFSVDRDILKLRMRLRAPSPGHATAQVVTSPCVVLAVSPRGWRRIEVTGITDSPIITFPGQ